MLLPAQVQLRLNLLIRPLNAIFSLERKSFLLFNLLQLILQRVHLGHQERLFIPCHGLARNHISILHFHVLKFLFCDSQFFAQLLLFALKPVDIICNQPQLLRHLFQIVEFISAWQSLNSNLAVTEYLVEQLGGHLDLRAQFVNHLRLLLRFASGPLQLQRVRLLHLKRALVVTLGFGQLKI